MKKKLLLLLIPILLTGCIKRDSMDDINIYTSSYVSEYITNYLYGDRSNVKDIYPDGVIINEYDLTDIQIEEYSNTDLFIYNGLGKEQDYVNKMKKLNKNLKIIDIAYSMEYDNSIEELYINPSNFLMISQNIKNGLEEYINNQYLKDLINTNYNKLKVEVSNFDAKIYLLVNQCHNPNILVFDSSLKFLEKYGLTVYVIDNNTTEKDKDTIKSLIEEDKLNYVYGLTNSEISKETKSFYNDNNLELVRLNDLTNLTESDRKSKKDYLTISNDNLDLIKNEIFHE